MTKKIMSHSTLTALGALVVFGLGGCQQIDKLNTGNTCIFPGGNSRATPFQTEKYNAMVKDLGGEQNQSWCDAQGGQWVEKASLANPNDAPKSMAADYGVD